MYKHLPKTELQTLIHAWMEEYLVYAPNTRHKPDRFTHITESAQAILDAHPNTTYPPKSLFLPQSEVLLRMVAGTLQQSDEASPPMLVLSIRPCDVQGLNLLDKVFLRGDTVDPYWKAKREQATLVSVACSEPCRSCFCMAVGLSPFDSCGADAMLIPQQGAYIVRISTEKGRRLFHGLQDASPAQIEEMNQSRKSAEAGASVPFLPKDLSSQAKLPWHFRQIARPESSTGEQESGKAMEAQPWNLRAQLYAVYDSEFWARIERACIGCGVCTFLCPTCHCFDIVDEFQRGERVRNWDTCMFRIYSQEASGHNPRTSNLERMRNRIMHKYAYFSDRFKALGCTGCGRCVRHCPANIDIREIIRNALEYKSA